MRNDPPDGIWFGREDNSRVPAIFPVGLRSEVPDPDLRSLHDKLLGIERPEPPRPIADRVVEIIETWTGDPLRKIDGGTVAVAPSEIFLLHWMAAFTSDSPPRFELWVEPKGPWSPPESTPDFAVVRKSGNVIAIGPVANTGGWHVWRAARDVASALNAIPDGSTLTLAMARRLDDGDDDLRPEVGRALYSGDVTGGAWEIAESSPQLTRDRLADALDFTRAVALEDRLRVRAGAERAAFDKEADGYAMMAGPVEWDGDVVRLVEKDQRMLIILATAVFRARFGDVWPVDVADDDDEDAEL